MNNVLDLVKKFFNEYNLKNFGNDIEFAALECKRFIGFNTFDGSSVIFNYKLSPLNHPPTTTAEILFLDDSYEISSKIFLDFKNWSYSS